MDLDTRFTLWAASIGGALGSVAERLFTYLKLHAAGVPNPVAGQPNLPNPMSLSAFIQDKTPELLIYLFLAAVVVTAAMMLFPINRQNRAQLIGTAITFGLVWPSVMDRLLVVAGIALKQQ